MEVHSHLAGQWFTPDLLLSLHLHDVMSRRVLPSHITSCHSCHVMSCQLWLHFWFKWFAIEITESHGTLYFFVCIIAWI